MRRAHLEVLHSPLHGPGELLPGPLPGFGDASRYRPDLMRQPLALLLQRRDPLLAVRYSVQLLRGTLAKRDNILDGRAVLALQFVEQ